MLEDREQKTLCQQVCGRKEVCEHRERGECPFILVWCLFRVALFWTTACREERSFMLFEPSRMLPHEHKRLVEWQSIGSPSMFWREKNVQESLPLLTDSALLRLYHQGDQRAFEQLVERYQAPLFCFLLGILRDPDTTEDVMQHVWIQCAFAASAPCRES